MTKNEDSRIFTGLDVAQGNDSSFITFYNVPESQAVGMYPCGIDETAVSLQRQVNAIRAEMYRPMFRKLARLLFRSSPYFMFLKSGYGRCKVPGCGRFAGQKRAGHQRPLCNKHQGSVKWQYLAQRNHG